MFAAKSLSYKDFEKIKIGSTLSEVAEIDPMTQIYKPKEVKPYLAQKYDEKLDKYVEYTEIPDPVLSYKAYHYLKDGVLCLIYSRDNAESEFIVSSIEYNESFEIASTNRKGTLPMVITAEDYPQ